MKLNFKLATVALAFSLIGFAAQAAPDYKIVETIAIGGDAKWDYLYADSNAHRLYVSHGTQTEVIDTQTNKVIGTIADTMGVHGIAIAKELGVGFTSDGKTNVVSVFDLDTFKVRSTITVGTSPDAMVYASDKQKLVVFNGHSNNVSIIDTKTLKVTATVAVGGKPEFAALGANGMVYFNLEDKSELLTLSLKTNKITKRISLKPCEEPTGLAMDEQQHIFSVCANNLMMVTTTDGKIIAKPVIGSGPDGVAFMDGYAFSANGADGTITAVGEVDGKFQTVATIPTQSGARTIAADPATHRLYLPTADFQPVAKGEKRQGVPNSFRVLVLQKQ